jgi:hypothetical protein
VGVPQLQRVQDENPTSWWGGGSDALASPLAAQGQVGVLWFMFPVPYDMIAIRHIQPTFSNALNLQPAWSNTTTNGLDGTFTNIGGTLQFATSSAQDAYRSGWQSIAVTNIKTLKLTYSPPTATYSNPTTLHLYGKPTTVPPVLVFWHPTLDQPLYTTPAHLDFGDVPRGGGALVKSFRVKNASPTLTASGITVSNTAMYDTTPTVVGQQQLRYNAGAYAASASVSSLAPNAISALFDLKYDPVAGATLSVWSQRLRAVASGWS